MQRVSAWSSSFGCLRGRPQSSATLLLIGWSHRTSIVGPARLLLLLVPIGQNYVLHGFLRSVVNWLVHKIVVRRSPKSTTDLPSLNILLRAAYLMAVVTGRAKCTCDISTCGVP